MQIVVDGLTHEAVNSSLSKGAYYPNALACLGYEGNNPPVADLLRRSHQCQGQWLLASPIHWTVTHNDAMIVATDALLDLSEAESRAYFSLVAEFLKSSGMDCLYHDAYTWLVRCDNQPPITTASVYSILHQSMMTALNALDKTLFWQRLLTELQMVLSASSLNLKRGHKPSFNGLWLWGNGAFSPHAPGKIWTDDEAFLKINGLYELVVDPLTTESGFKKQDFIFIKSPNEMLLASLRQQTKKNKNRWYWNNGGIQPLSSRWWFKRKALNANSA